MARIVQARDPQSFRRISIGDRRDCDSRQGGWVERSRSGTRSPRRSGRVSRTRMVRQAAFLIPDVEQMRADGQETLPQRPAPTGAVDGRDRGGGKVLRGARVQPVQGQGQPVTIAA